MTDLVPYQPGPGSSIELAADAWPLAQKIARTEFVPKSLRDRPEAVLACMLTGHEVGVGPMQSLAKIHVIEGRPALAAELMRALILRAGHTFDIEEITNTRVTVVGSRVGSTRETRISWTLDDARRAKVGGKDVWQKFPRAMLLARATAELARAVFPDVLAGLSYTIEELSAGDVEDPLLEILEADVVAERDASAAVGANPAAAPAKKVAAKKAATRKAAPKATTRPGEEPPLPGEEQAGPGPGNLGSAPGDDDGIVDAELVDDHEGDDVSIEREARPLSGPAAIVVALKKHGIEDREEKLRIVGHLLDREVSSTNELAPDEFSIVLGFLASDHEDVIRSTIDEALGRADRATSPPPPPPPPPPAPPRETVAANPDTWDEAAWRSFVSSRSVKVTELIREAQRLAREDGDQGPGSLGDLVTSASSSVKSILVGFVEDLAAQRGAGS